MKYEDLLPLIDALPEEDRRRVAAYAASHVTEPAAIAVAAAAAAETVREGANVDDFDARILLDIDLTDPTIPVAGLEWLQRLNEWRVENKDSLLSDEEHDYYFGRRNRSVGRRSPSQWSE